MNALPRLSRRAFVAGALHSSAAVLLAQPGSAAVSLPVHQARAISIGPDDVLAVAADREILLCRTDGALLRRVTTPRPVRALCHDAGGRLWMTWGGQVAVLPASGAPETVGAGVGEKAALTGITVAEDGRIFAADSARRIVWRLDAAGGVLGQVAAAEGGFAVPRAFFPIAWQGGQLVVVEPGRHRVHRFTAEGRLLSTWGGRSREMEGFAGCCNPVAVAPQADGSVVTVERGQVRVKRFDRDGKLMAQLAGPESFPAQAPADEDDALAGCEAGLLDVACARDGRIIVLDRTTRELRVLA